MNVKRLGQATTVAFGLIAAISAVNAVRGSLSGRPSDDFGKRVYSGFVDGRYIDIDYRSTTSSGEGNVRVHSRPGSKMWIVDLYHVVTGGESTFFLDADSSTGEKPKPVFLEKLLRGQRASAADVIITGAALDEGVLYYEDLYGSQKQDTPIAPKHREELRARLFEQLNRISNAYQP